MMDQDQKLEIVRKIFDWKDPDDPDNLKVRFYMSSHPAQGEFVKVGPMGYGLSTFYIGYCVQVRKKAGLHGSHQVFLRHPDGSTVCHENQGFFSLSDEQVLMAKSIFDTPSEKEDYARGYRCSQGIHRIGFVIEPEPANNN